VSAAAAAAQAVPEAALSLFSATPLPHQRCGEVPTEGLELSEAERELLPYICWPLEVTAAVAPAPALQAARVVPAGINCTVEQR